MTWKNGFLCLTLAAVTAVFSGCYAHSAHYTASYDYYEPAYVEEVYVEEVYVERPVYYSKRGHHYGRRHCY